MSATIHHPQCPTIESRRVEDCTCGGAAFPVTAPAQHPPEQERSAQEIAKFWTIYSPLPSDEAWPWADMQKVARAFLALASEHQQLREAALAVCNEWEWPVEEPPSETYFHDLVVKLDKLARDA